MLITWKWIKGPKLLVLCFVIVKQTEFLKKQDFSTVILWMQQWEAYILLYACFVFFDS